MTQGNDRDEDATGREGNRPMNEAGMIEEIRRRTAPPARSSAERRAFEARLEERLTRSTGWVFPEVPTLAPVWATAALGLAALVFFFFPRASVDPSWVDANPSVENRQETPAPVRSIGTDFLAAAYYADQGVDLYADRPNGADSGSQNSGRADQGSDYLPSEYQLWADAFYETEEVRDAS